MFLVMVLISSMCVCTTAAVAIAADYQMKFDNTQREIKDSYGTSLSIQMYPYQYTTEGPKALGNIAPTLHVTDVQMLSCSSKEMQNGCSTWFTTNLNTTMPDFMIASGRFNESVWKTFVGADGTIVGFSDPTKPVLITHANKGTKLNDYVQLASADIVCDDYQKTEVHVEFCMSANFAVRLCVTQNYVIGTRDELDSTLDSIPSTLCKQVGIGGKGCFAETHNLSLGINEQRLPLIKQPYRLVLMVGSGAKQAYEENIFVLKKISVTSPSCPPQNLTQRDSQLVPTNSSAFATCFCCYECDFATKDKECTKRWLDAAGHSANSKTNNWQWSNVVGNPLTGIRNGKLGKGALDIPIDIGLNCHVYLAAYGAVGLMSDKGIPKRTRPFVGGDWKSWQSCAERFRVTNTSGDLPNPTTVPEMRSVYFAMDNNRYQIDNYQQNLAHLGIDEVYFTDANGVRVCQPEAKKFSCGNCDVFRSVRNSKSQLRVLNRVG